jgi:50S ribosomal protein L16 3-hydroxylase
MLATWLGSTSLDAFRDQHLQRAPVAVASTIDDPRSLLDWDLLAAVLGGEPAPDVLVVARGQLLPLPPPRALDELRAYFRMGIGLCLRHTERCHRGLRAIADAFEADLGAAQVQVFVTPSGTYGFGWHYDDEDVFIVQTEGIKDYYFRANTIAADIHAHSSAFRRFDNETSALCTARLVPGDFLYLPARWWHMALCRETALSISVGVRKINGNAGRSQSRAASTV